MAAISGRRLFGQRCLSATILNRDRRLLGCWSKGVPGTWALSGIRGVEVNDSMWPMNVKYTEFHSFRVRQVIIGMAASRRRQFFNDK